MTDPLNLAEHFARSLTGRDFAVWKRTSKFTDDDPVLFITGVSIPVDELSLAIAELPRPIRPVSVVRVAEIPRDTTTAKIQRRRLSRATVIEQIEVSDL
jgi:hypothetical protein